MYRLILLAIIWTISTCICYGQTGNVQEILRVKGIAVYSSFTMGNLRATPSGVSIALQILRGKANGPFVRDSSYAITITDQGLDTVSLRFWQSTQGVLYGRALYSALYGHPDTLMIETDIRTGAERFFLKPNSIGRSVNINCVDGSIALYDLSQGYFVWRDTSASPVLIENHPAENAQAEVFSISGDLYIVDSKGVNRVVYGESERTRLDLEDTCANPKEPNFSSITIRQDTLCWNGQSRTSYLSVSSKTFSCNNTVPSIVGSSTIGKYGSLVVTPQVITAPYTEYSTDHFIIQYVQPTGKSIYDTIQEPSLHNIAAGVGWWNGAFYFTAEVRDSGAPYETAESIIYKYTEPIPVVSVENQLPFSGSSKLVERLVFTQDAYVAWLAALGTDVSVFDLLGNEVTGVAPRPGYLCVRSASKWWFVAVLP